jgi:hypothetical protein
MWRREGTFCEGSGTRRLKMGRGRVCQGGIELRKLGKDGKVGKHLRSRVERHLHLRPPTRGQQPEPAAVGDAFFLGRDARCLARHIEGLFANAVGCGFLIQLTG